MRLRASKKFYYSLIGVIAIFVIAFLAFVISPFAKNGIPSTFNEARINASSLSQEIVSILGETSGSIGKLQEAQRQSESLEIVLNSMQDVKNARDKASELALQLEKMALSVPDISPDKAKQTAIVAISSETALINKLISYNEGLNNLLFVLQKRFNGGNVSIENINNLIDDINRTADEINEFNKQFVDLIKKFDSYYEE